MWVNWSPCIDPMEVCIWKTNISPLRKVFEALNRVGTWFLFVSWLGYRTDVCPFWRAVKWIQNTRQIASCDCIVDWILRCSKFYSVWILHKWFFLSQDDMWKALVLFCSLIPMCQSIINMPTYLDVLRFAGCTMMSLTGSPLCTRARSPYIIYLILYIIYYINMIFIYIYT